MSIQFYSGFSYPLKVRCYNKFSYIDKIMLFISYLTSNFKHMQILFKNNWEQKTKINFENRKKIDKLMSMLIKEKLNLRRQIKPSNLI